MQNPDITKPLSDVMTVKPLEWVEVLAYMQKLGWAVDMLERLQKWLNVSSMPTNAVSSYAYDVKRFIQAFSNGIMESPLQIYWSGLLFTPQQTMLYYQYQQHVCKLPVKVVEGFELEWNGVLNTLTGHDGAVETLAFSPDGTVIASGSSDRTVRIWDAKTGAAVGQPLQGHTDSVTSVTFSPDGTLIASGSDDGTVCIWDAKTGAAVGQPLQGHANWVKSVAFSPDGTFIASGSDSAHLGCKDWCSSWPATSRAHRLGHLSCLLS